MHTTVKSVVGAKDIRGLVEQLFLKHKDIDCVFGLSDLDLLEQNFPEYQFSSANVSRMAADIRSCLVYTASNGPILKASDDRNHRESRFLPSDQRPFPGDFTIFGDTVLILFFDKNTQPTAVSIQSIQLAQQFKTLFDFCWELAK